MSLRFYNTLARAEEEFLPLDPEGRRVRLYCCGPTVYDYAHIGNFRTFVFEDLLRRHLEASGFEVLHVMNVTDVEDKIIRAVRESGETLQGLTRRYEKAFSEDMETLGCLRPQVMPRATEHVAEIIAFIQRLERNGFAYQAADGSVYFSIEKFPSYGRLARLDRSQLKPGARVSQDEHSREAYGDFALWKAHTERDGSIFWESPWGRGRPGWHIECSCMSMKHLGESFDFHCGGEDLVFPHHEDEIAQSEAATGRPFVRFWLHSAHLMVNGQKMSKSAGNFFTLRDLLARGYTGRELRYALISVHYRLPLNFTMEHLDATRQTLRRLDPWVERLGERASAADGGARPEWSGALWRAFHESLDADLNISEALGHLFEAVRASNRQMDDHRLAGAEATGLLSDWRKIERALGLSVGHLEEAPPDEVIALARERDAARKGRDWEHADELRAAIRAKGWVVQDLPGGHKLTRL
ncbi:MAG: cysteine--tRNA ligase [Verrucomicrobia bacterium]|nr:cysteine--tRNA ligase [Verrucomicrobiota bacterium]